MNKKQKIILWVGIAIFVFAGLYATDSYNPNIAILLIVWFMVVVVTAGLIYTLKDKKLLEGQKQKVVNLKQGFKRLTLVLAIVAATISAIITAGIIVYEEYDEAGYEKAREQLDNNEIEIRWKSLMRQLRDPDFPMQQFDEVYRLESN